MSEIENPSLLTLDADIARRGFDQKAIARVIFRLNFVEKALKERNKVIREGNLVTLAPELFQTNEQVQDFVDIVREMISLINFREEQGLISPPHPEASGTETLPAA